MLQRSAVHTEQCSILYDIQLRPSWARLTNFLIISGNEHRGEMTSVHSSCVSRCPSQTTSTGCANLIIPFSRLDAFASASSSFGNSHRLPVQLATMCA